MIHLKKVLNFRFLVLEAHRHGIIQRAPHPFAVKSIFHFFAIMKMEDAQ
jgi:hypothetical protein